MARLFAACIVLGSVVFAPAVAQACMIQERPSVESLQKAPVAFIGTVIDDPQARDRQEVTFVVQKALRGVPAEAKQISIDLGDWTSCDTAFGVGERWLYLGKHIRDNSLRLETWLGVSVADNIAFVREQAGAIEAAQSLAHGGEFKTVCKDGREVGFTIALDNGMHLEVFSKSERVLAGHSVERSGYTADLDTYDVMTDFFQNMPGVRLDSRVPLDRQRESWSGTLDMCETHEDCTPIQGGMLSLGEVSPNLVTGRIFMQSDARFPSAYVFRVTRSEGEACQ